MDTRAVRVLVSLAALFVAAVAGAVGDSTTVRQRAEAGEPAAQFDLGLMYATGAGVDQDDAAAASWYRKAADRNFAAAQVNLGAAYHDGRGVPRDAAAAITWYRKAADQGNAAGQYNLGVGYRHLLPNNVILGANVYYDYRETQLGSEFEQLGLGVEVLSEWVDARANYYLPEDDKELINEFDTETSSSSKSVDEYWLSPYARGHTIFQKKVTEVTRTTTTIKQHFEQYEQAMEGWDAEVGVKHQRNAGLVASHEGEHEQPNTLRAPRAGAERPDTPSR